MTTQLFLGDLSAYPLDGGWDRVLIYSDFFEDIGDTGTATMLRWLCKYQRWPNRVSLQTYGWPYQFYFLRWDCPIEPRYFDSSVGLRSCYYLPPCPHYIGVFGQQNFVHLLNTCILDNLPHYLKNYPL